jgi:hypothetical protein
MKRQQFLDGPAMIGDPSDHGGRSLHTRPADPRGGEAQTLMIGTEVVDRANQIHPVPQRLHLTRQYPAAARQRGQAFAERRVQSLNIGLNLGSLLRGAV